MTIEWDDRLPPAILNEIEEIRDRTKHTGKENSITVCKQDSKYYTGGDEPGDETSTAVAECRNKFGTGERAADVHTHPWADDNFGGSIIPSVADFTGYMETSYLEESRQIGCVTNSQTPYVQCVQPKSVPDKQKKNAYVRALDKQYSTTKSKKSQYVSFDEPFFQDNIHKDYDIAFYEKDNGKRVRKPEPKKIIKCSLGNSNRRFRYTVRELEKGAFCKMIQNLTVPDDDKVGEECRNEVKTRKLLGGLLTY